MQGINLIQLVVVIAIPLLFAITLHEAAHGWMAKRLGDSTAQRLGRITLNPIKHIDPIGTVLIPLLLILSSFIFGGPLFLFGWAKPVPVTVENLRKPRRDMALVALAGPGVNLLMAFIWGMLIYPGIFLLQSLPWIAIPLVLMGVAGAFFNTILMALNMMPILPLDGGRVLYSLLPRPLARVYAGLERYGLFILIILLTTGLLGQILWPLVSLTIQLLPASDVVSQLLPIILNPSRS
ncbi:site-2 protease family protein [Candidatus Endoriftia persephone]|jgi:Zn-dependent protease|uniref:Peptidase, M50 family n=3 Tax=Gammaproteobacteria TaxID=1236 RepID=G2FEC5_9GAMM|nr:site-2 protease family protein [Candidatus Endoriftia persephone]EGV50624.1 peptidase, M50 family [endosymbiont of Riftia pachyptila (vent Ph05)]EGW54895.1 peptidase, M50 family [endosymbiont of Tevnia jerichonana (vent Tica)]USF89128.1 site-2 protease family protein [Candidatus Endoriftia persephone]